MANSDLLNLSYHSTGKFATEPPSRAINMRIKITQPSGAATPAGQRRASCASLSRRLSAFFGSASDQGPKAAKFAVLIPGPGIFVNVRNGPRVVIPPPSETPPVSACEPPCAVLLAKASEYPLSPVKANVGHL